MPFTNDTKPSASYTNDTKPSGSFSSDSKGGTTLIGTPVGLLLAITKTLYTPNSYTNDTKP